MHEVLVLCARSIVTEQRLPHPMAIQSLSESNRDQD